VKQNNERQGVHHRRSYLYGLANMLLLVAWACHPATLAGAGGVVQQDSAPEETGGAPETTTKPHDGSTAGDNLADVVIYAHSSDTLYLFSPYHNRVVAERPLLVSDGSPAPPMIDLAVTADGQVFSSGFDALYRVDPDSAVVQWVGDFNNDQGQLLGPELDVHLYALSFIPGSLFPQADSDEVLVGAANDGTCFEIDPRSARVRSIGRYPAPWGSSGDLVAVEQLGTIFATIRDRHGPSSERPDYVTEIAFVEGGIIQFGQAHPVRDGSHDFNQIYGLGYWGRALYGFSNKGELISIDPATGHSQLVTDQTGADQFWGAGVTTRVPVLF
jgi:hypothetical protein